MSARNISSAQRLLITVAVSSVFSGVALAGDAVSSDGYKFVGGEIGYVPAMQSPSAADNGMAPAGLTRAQVQQEFKVFKMNPVTGDGLWRITGGEAGYVPVLQAPSALGSGTGAQPGGLTRMQVQEELKTFKMNPISGDGQSRYVGGEQGWIDR